MTTRLLTLLIWAAVAASAVAWGLRLFVRPTPVPAQAALAGAAAPAAADLGRLLGQPPAAPPPEAPAPEAADARFRLLGVVAPRAGQAGGLALISVDGKAAQAMAPGRELAPGLRLLRVSHRQVELGAAAGGPATVTLSLPALPEPARGRPGEAGLPAAMPGMAPPAPVPGLPGRLGAVPAPPAGEPAHGQGAGPAVGQALPGVPVQAEQQ